MKILTIIGSLRKDSLNRKAALALQEEMPKEVDMVFGDIADIPMYNFDLQQIGFPDAVNKLVDQIKAADAVVFATPEYNYSVPGVLKNAIDWVSRHPGNPMARKTAGIIGASPGNIGTARAQYHLRQMGVFLDIQFINKPEVMIGAAVSKFDESGRLVDQSTRDHLKKFGVALVEAAKKSAQTQAAL